MIDANKATRTTVIDKAGVVLATAASKQASIFFSDEGSFSKVGGGGQNQ